MLTKEQILSAKDLPTRELPVPEWGGSVILKTLTGTERDAYEAGLLGKKPGQRNLVNLRARLCALVLVDESGVPLFNEYEVVQLGRKSAAAIDRIFAAAQEMNGISDKDVEDLEKNSGTGLSEDSTSA